MKRVAVLLGGRSAEREVSLVSGRACAEALREAGYDAYEVLLNGDVGEMVRQLTPKPDAAFNALHGRWGEDGCVQGLLELMGIPYTHSGPLASALAMDKPMAKRIFAAAGLRCPEGLEVGREALLAGDPLPRPYVAKPANEGSSVGVAIVRQGSNSEPRTTVERTDDERWLVERYVPGRELTVAVMGDRALAVTEIAPKDGFYDYAAKYTEGRAVHVVPAQVPDTITEQALEWAARAHRALGCEGVSRADFRYDDTAGEPGELFLLEVNTQPGMTALSLVPEQAAHLGMSFPELCAWIVEQARCHE